jgi:hypothetical protein
MPGKAVTDRGQALKKPVVKPVSRSHPPSGAAEICDAATWVSHGTPRPPTRETLHSSRGARLERRLLLVRAGDRRQIDVVRKKDLP